MLSHLKTDFWFTPWQKDIVTSGLCAQCTLKREPGQGAPYLPGCELDAVGLPVRGGGRRSSTYTTVSDITLSNPPYPFISAFPQLLPVTCDLYVSCDDTLFISNWRCRWSRSKQKRDWGKGAKQKRDWEWEWNRKGTEGGPPNLLRDGVASKLWGCGESAQCLRWKNRGIQPILMCF